MNFEVPPITMSKTIIQGMKIQKVFKHHLKQPNSIDFSKDGKLLLTCDDNTLSIIDVLNVKVQYVYYIIEFDMNQAKFTHNPAYILIITKSKPFNIMYWALNENEIIRHFIGHTDLINSLYYSKNYIISSSLDLTIRIWNHIPNIQQQEQSNGCQKIMNLKEQSNYCIAALDPSECVFAAGITQQNGGIAIYLYDLEKCHFGALNNKIICNKSSKVKQLQFSSDSKMLFFLTDEYELYVLEGYKLELIKKIIHLNQILTATFISETYSIVCGTKQGSLQIYSYEENIKKKQDDENEQTNAREFLNFGKLEGHILSCNNILCAPKESVLITTCRNVIFWTPGKIVDF